MKTIPAYLCLGLLLTGVAPARIAPLDIDTQGTASTSNLGRFWYHSNTYGDLYAWEEVTGGSSTNTAISGFSSLAAINPGDLTLSFSSMPLISITNNPDNTVTELYAGATFTLTGPGLSASGSVVQLSIITNKSSDTAIGVGQVTLSGAPGDPFFQDVTSLTGGSNLLSFHFDSYDPVSVTPTGAVYSSTGHFTVVPVPEPADTAVILAAGGALFASVRRRGKKSPLRADNRRDS